VAVVDKADTEVVDDSTFFLTVDRLIEPEVTRTDTFFASVLGSSEFSWTTINESGFIRYWVPSGNKTLANESDDV
jgi:hypothetical protein